MVNIHNFKMWIWVFSKKAGFGVVTWQFKISYEKKKEKRKKKTEENEQKIFKNSLWNMRAQANPKNKKKAAFCLANEVFC